MEIGTAERLTAAASYDLLKRLTEKGVISKERFAKLCSLLRQYNQGTMLFLRNGAVIGTAPLRSQYNSIARSGAAPLNSAVFLQNL